MTKLTQAPNTDETAPKVWWESKAQIGTLVTMFASVLGIAGYVVDAQQVTEIAWLAVTLISSLLAFWGNVTRTGPLDTKQVLPGLRLKD